MNACTISSRQTAAVSRTNSPYRAYNVALIMRDRFNIWNGCLAGSPGEGASIEGRLPSARGSLLTGVAILLRNGADSSTSRLMVLDISLRFSLGASRRGVGRTPTGVLPCGTVAVGQTRSDSQLAESRFGLPRKARVSLMFRLQPASSYEFLSNAGIYSDRDVNFTQVNAHRAPPSLSKLRFFHAPNVTHLVENTMLRRTRHPIIQISTGADCDAAPPLMPPPR